MRAHPVLVCLITLLAGGPAWARTVPVDLGPGHAGWSLQLLPGFQRGAHRVLVFDAKGTLRQTLQHRADPGAGTALVVEDLDSDGYRDLAMATELGSRWSTYHVWRFDPRRGEFRENGITVTLGRLGPQLPRAREPAAAGRHGRARVATR